ncbi:uncharacterized protein [Littorina saxatilis]|uniref:uncharacterized protein isoform X2 n=1 Tax=Littorina saxatilis TaxID=31220 RepID=UPI0038B4E537
MWNWSEYSRSKADSISKQLGSQLARHVFDPNKLMNSVAYRMETFDHAGWQGAGKEEMAQSGFYYDESTGNVWCFVCCVKFRDMNRPGLSPWQVHAELAPNCCQLKRYQSSGHQAKALAKRRRHNSMSTVADMTRDLADIINP